MTDSFVSGEPGTKKVSDIVKLTPLFKVILSPKAAIASQLVFFSDAIAGFFERITFGCMTDSFVSGEPGTKKVSDIVKLTPLFKVILSPKAAIASQLVYIFSRKVKLLLRTLNIYFLILYYKQSL